MKINSISGKMITFTFLAVLISCIIVGTAGYIGLESIGQKLIGSEIISILKAVSININGDKFETIIQNASEESPEYKELQEYLLKVKNECGLKYLYSMSKNGDGKYFYVVDGNLKGNEGFSEFGSVDEEIDISGVKAFEEGKISFGKLEKTKEWGWLLSGYIPIKNSSGKIVGMLGADISGEQFKERLAFYRLMTIIIVILATTIISILSIIFVKRSICNIGLFCGVLKDVTSGSGDLTKRIKNDKICESELKEMSIYLNKFFEEINNILVNIKKQSEDLADNSHEQSCMSENISISAQNQAAEVEEIERNISEISESMKLISKSAAEQKEEISSTAIVLQNIEKKIKMVKDASNEAVKISEITIGKAKEGEESITKTVSGIKAIENNLFEIEDIISKISKISEQTNMLALNAAIEASRAGEAGRGFSIVADEVKNLAENSRNSAFEITEEINKIRNNVKISMSNSVDSRVKFENITKDIKENCEKFEELAININEETDEISKSSNRIYKISSDAEDIMKLTEKESEVVLEIVEQLKKVSSNIQETATQSEEMAASAVIVAKSASVVKESIDIFKLEK